jgi:hypothetical protein
LTNCPSVWCKPLKKQPDKLRPVCGPAFADAHSCPAHLRVAR